MKLLTAETLHQSAGHICRAGEAVSKIGGLVGVLYELQVMPVGMCKAPVTSRRLRVEKKPST